MSSSPPPLRNPTAGRPDGAAGKTHRDRKKGRRRSALGVDEPQRSCIVCRATGPAATMLRFARSADGAVGLDVAGRLPGRGAWVCAAARCLEKAVEPKHGGFARAFDAPCLTTAALTASVRATLRADVLSRLGLLRRAGALVLGREEVGRRVEGLALLALADDLSAGSRREVAELVGGRACERLPTMAEVGAAVGGRPVGVVGAPAGGATTALARAIARWSGVEGSASVGDDAPATVADEDDDAPPSP